MTMYEFADGLIIVSAIAMVLFLVVVALSGNGWFFAEIVAGLKDIAVHMILLFAVGAGIFICALGPARFFEILGDILKAIAR